MLRSWCVRGKVRNGFTFERDPLYTGGRWRMGSGTGAVAQRGQAQASGATGPTPGGTLTLPTGDAKTALTALRRGVASLPELNTTAARSAYLQLVLRSFVAKHGRPPQGGDVVDLPPLQALNERSRRSEVTGEAGDGLGQMAKTPAAVATDQRAHDAFADTGAGGVSLRAGGQIAGAFTVAKGASEGATLVERVPATPLNPEVEAGRLESALKRGDFATMLVVFHGRSKADQQAIIAAFNRRPFAADVEVPYINAGGFSPGGLLANWVQRKAGATRTEKNDFMSRLARMGGRERARITAHIDNPSSQLEPADKWRLSMLGGGTYEEGIHRQLRNMTRAQIEEQALLYARRYHQIQNPSVDRAMDLLKGDLGRELSGVDRVKALLYLRGKNHIGQADHKALELYAYGAGIHGTAEEPLFRLLEGESAASIRAIAQAYENLPEVKGKLFGDLDGEFDGVWFQRMEAAYAGNDAPYNTRAKYVAHSAELYLRGEITWGEMGNILNKHIDPTGQGGPTVAQVEAMFVSLGYWGDMTDRMRFKGAEVKGLVDVLEAGEDVRTSPRARAIRFYHMTTGKDGTDEEGACALLDGTTARERQEIDRELRTYSKARGRELSLEQAIRDDFSDSPAWMARALDHLQHGELPPERLLFHVSRGAGEGSEVVRAIANLPMAERATLRQRYVQAHYAPQPPKLDGPAATDLTAAQPLGSATRFDGMVARMEDGFRARQAQGHGWNSLEGQDHMMRLASTFAVQLGVDIMRTQGEEGLAQLASSPDLESLVLAQLRAANQRDAQDGRIRQDNLQRIAAHVTGVLRGQWPEFDRATRSLGDRESRAVQDLMAAGELRDQGIAGLKARVGAQIQRERGADGWNAVSRALMDKFGWTGEFADEAARDFFLAIERAGADDKLTQDELQGVLDRYSEFLELVREYQTEKDGVAEVAGDIAAAAAATIVTIASGGSAAPLVVAIAVGTAGVAKVGSEAAFRGRDYQLGSPEFWKDLAVGGLDGAVTVYTAGMSKAATGAKFLRAVAIEANAAGLGGAAASLSRTAMDGATWESGEAAERLVKSGALGYALGAGAGSVMSGVVRGTGAATRGATRAPGGTPSTRPVVTPALRPAAAGDGPFPGISTGRVVSMRAADGTPEAGWVVVGRADDGHVVLRNAQGRQQMVSDRSLVEANPSLKSPYYVAPTPQEIAAFQAFRQTYARPWQKTVDMLEELFPNAEIPHRLKGAERIHEAFFRKGWTFDTIDDVAGICVVTDSLESSVDVVKRLQAALRERGIKILDPSEALNAQGIERLLARDKKWFRTTGFVIEVDGKPIEVGIQTRAQRAWTELVHDTPVYKPNIFQQPWGLDNTRTKALQDYAVQVSKYLHYRELQQMAARGTYTGPLTAVSKPSPRAVWDLGTHNNPRVLDLVQKLERLAGD